ncbi:Adenylate kinase 2 mitochondrial [Dissostichus eleginoides]|uniref:Adenylate kinase 2 mitochondrial n=1 Tax=Dissostichus eleginoides TaxID=100907 RepID=A0AAD9FEZ1_DISEL|nr:Adenylate kinase 2 mitochondrial [Dissostichus eleginoides]
MAPSAQLKDAIADVQEGIGAILLGPPGAGKGTQRNLPDFLSFLYQPVDCSLCEGLGKIFRENPKDVKFIYKVPRVSSAALQPAV